MSCYAHAKIRGGSSISSIARSSRSSANAASPRICASATTRAIAVGSRRLCADVPGVSRYEGRRDSREMASREFARSRSSAQIAKVKDVAVGIIDVKSYYIETRADVADRVRLCLKHAPPSGSASPRIAA